jgi:membrane protein HdeD
MKRSIWTLIMGILMIGAGVLALIHPFPASLAVVVFAAWSFIVLGVLQLVAAFRDAEGGSRIWLIILALVMIWIGFVLRGNPLEGLVTLTIVVALSFVASGIAKLVVGWGIRSIGLGGWVMVSGLLSVVLGVMLMGNILGAAPWVLGFLLGIELISDGFAALFLWHAGSKA